jgi:nucleotide-binding universal stress UspA family protein
MIRKILLCIDQSEHAKRNVEYAYNLAKELNAKLSILHVITFPYVSAPEANIDQQFFIKEAEKFFNDIKKDIEAQKIKISINVMSTYGSGAHVIIEYAKKEKFDLLALGAMGTSEIKDLFLGSVAHTVARHSPCSVLIIK